MIRTRLVNNGFVLTSFSIEVDIKTKRLAAQAKSRYATLLERIVKIKYQNA
jgi:hypothetical protein